MGIQRPSQEVSSVLINLDFDDISTEIVLGALWNLSIDALQIKVTAKDVPLTKRGILIYASAIFDPLAILAPIILEPKLIIQSLDFELYYKKLQKLTGIEKYQRI